MNTKMLKPTVLSISLLTVMASAAIAPALVKISEAFPGTDRTLIQLTLTMPALLIIPFSLFGGWLASKIKKKTILIIGLIIYLIGGIGGCFAGDITTLLILRGVLGIGVGLIMPLSTSLIAEFFDGDERKTMIGYSGAMANLGGAILQSVAGWLAVFSWRYTFGAYAIALVILVMVLLWMPEPKTDPSQAKSAKQNHIKLPAGVWFASVCVVLLMITIYSLQTNLGLLIENERHMFASEVPLFSSKDDLLKNLETRTISDQTVEAFQNEGINVTKNAIFVEEEPGKIWSIAEGAKKYIVRKVDDRLEIYTGAIGKPQMVGYALSLMPLCGMLTGLLLKRILQKLGKFAIPSALISMTLGFTLIGNAVSIWMVFIAMPCIGLGFGIIVPTINLYIQRITQPSTKALGMAIVGSAIFLGQFISPIMLKLIAVVAGNDASYLRFQVLGVGLAIATVISILLPYINSGDKVRMS